MRTPNPNMPFFSVAIPQYDRTSFLLKTLQSIVTQTFRDFEICISDDVSPDGRQQEVVDFLTAAKVSFRFEQNPTNVRYDKNLRNAIGLTSGRYVFLLGNDDALIDATVFERTAAKLEEQSFPAVLVSNWLEEAADSKNVRIPNSCNLGYGPEIAAQVWREYSFVSGVIFDGPRIRAMASPRWDGSEMYQMWLGARLVSEGGVYYGWNETLILKDLQIPGEIVDSYRQKKQVPWFTERLHTLHLLARLNYDGIAPSVPLEQRPALAKLLIKTLYSTIYPFWLFEYRATQSWKFALAIALGMRPKHATAEMPLGLLSRIQTSVRWFVVTLAGLLLPVSLFNAFKPMLHAYVKRSRLASTSAADTNAANTSAALAARPSTSAVDILFVGNQGGTNVAQSLANAATARGLTHHFLDQRRAYSSNRLRQGFYWHLAGHRPALLANFSKQVLEAAQQLRPKTLICTGISPIHAKSLKIIKSLGVRVLNFSTDDPWNHTMRARFFLDALPNFDVVFTPRTENMKDFEDLGVDTRWLPFGYDAALFFPEALPLALHQSLEVPLLFVGGGDQDRANYLTPLVNAELGLNIFGSEFERFTSVVRCLRGRLEPTELRQRTIAARVNICLVRHANRDQHVMRTLEIAACGGCILLEDTLEHRSLFGDSACYFNSPLDLVTKARLLLANPIEQQRIRLAAHAVVVGKHRYDNRLADMLAQ